MAIVDELRNIFVLTNKIEDKNFSCVHEKAGHFVLVIFQSPVLFSYDAVNYFPVRKNSVILYSPQQLQAYKSNDSYFLNSFLILDADYGFFNQFHFPLNKPFSLSQKAIDEAIVILDGVSFIRNTDYFPEKRAQVPSILRNLFEKIDQAYSSSSDSKISLLYALKENILNDPVGTTVSSLALKAGYSKSYFCKLYRQHFGISPGKERQNQIVRLIREYLESTDYSLETIAELCGISSLPFLIKIFKRSEGLTPHQYRLQKAQKGSPSKKPNSQFPCRQDPDA